MSLTEHDGILKVEVEQDDHLSVAWLEEGVLDVVVHDVHLVAPDARVAEPVGVRLQHTGQPLLHDVWPKKSSMFFKTKKHYSILKTIKKVYKSNNMVLRPSVADPHWFQCGSGSSIFCQCGSGSKILTTKNWKNL